ncbi:MAG: response regulator [bacterium]|jgi:DNA-binding response OmpR family regulator|nr:response regulator [bacterium]
MTNKILVVDDEPDFCEALREFLEERGFSVVLANSCEEGLSAYRQHRPDIVLLDIQMPGKDGRETLQELKAFDPEVNVIMITALHEEDLALETMADGAFDYITKPVNPDYLEMALMTKIRLIERN